LPWQSWSRAFAGGLDESVRAKYLELHRGVELAEGKKEQAKSWEPVIHFLSFFRV
jgi:hypothetical protein